jgi:hypothetical protein
VFDELSQLTGMKLGEKRGSGVSLLNNYTTEYVKLHGGTSASILGLCLILLTLTLKMDKTSVRLHIITTWMTTV